MCSDVGDQLNFGPNSASIKKLILTGTNISDHTLEDISKYLTKLESLSLQQCNCATNEGISKIIETCCNLKNLNLNDFSHGTLQDSAFGKIGFLNSLQILALKNAKSITCESLLQISKCKTLFILNLDGCDNISTFSLCSLLDSIGFSLQTINLGTHSQLDFEKLLPYVAEYCPKLKHINLSYCKPTNFSEQSVKIFLQKCKNLQILNLMFADPLFTQIFINLLPKYPCKYLQRLNYVGLTTISNTQIELIKSTHLFIKFSKVK